MFGCQIYIHRPGGSGMGIPGSVISKTLYMNKPSHTTFLDFSNYQWSAGEPIRQLIVHFSGYDITTN